MKKVCVIGLGYIGLPTALLAAQSGLTVVGVDIDEQRVKKINASDAIVHEPEIDEQLQLALEQGHFRATTEYEEADYFVVTVQTPLTDEGKPDLSFVSSAASSIGVVLKAGDVVILESTVPIGSTASFTQALEQESGLKHGKDFFVAHCPERVLPGNIFQELRVNDRIIGGVDPNAMHLAAEFYKYFVSGDLYLTNAVTAELVKLVENSHRDLEVAFAHQVATVAHAEGLDPFEVIELANKHPRVSLLKPSAGVGGHCLAVDPLFLAASHKQETELSQVARRINDARPGQIISHIASLIASHKKHTSSVKVAFLGVAYKPHTDDIRNSPALSIVNHFIAQKGITVLVADPYVCKDALPKELQAVWVDYETAAKQADIIVGLVGHTDFKELSSSLLMSKQVYDACGVFYVAPYESTEQEQFYWPAKTSRTFTYNGFRQGAHSKVIEGGA